MLVVIVLALASATGCGDSGDPVRSQADVERVGKWLVDPQGRVVVVHGFNVVQKNPPFVRTEFGPDDAQLLASEGFTVARVPFIWEAVEPQPGTYDDAYIMRVIELQELLAGYGIRTLSGFHQDFWSRTAPPGIGDGAPVWATVGSFNDSFAAFWRNDPGPGGVVIQTRFLHAWQHVAGFLRNRPNIIAIDPLNEPYPGSDYPAPCGPFTRCPQFETGALADFYRRVTDAIRSAGALQVIFPEGVAESGQQPPVLPKFADLQTGFNFHYYCSATQLAPQEIPVGAPSPAAEACAPTERTNIGRFTDYAAQLDVPGFLSEFSCNDINPDNAQVVDLVAQTFTSWTAWAYYPQNHPTDCPRQGLLRNNTQPVSEAVKQDKLDALAVPYAHAIAGTPELETLDRASRTYGLSYRSVPVPGAQLSSGALTEIFVPSRMYPAGYLVRVGNARIQSGANERWLKVSAVPNEEVSVTITPRQ